MDYGFNISINSGLFPIDDQTVALFKKDMRKVTVNLKQYLLQDGISIDAKKIVECLFPSSQCDIFISHSYTDQDLAIQLAIDLKKKGINAFVDSIAWGSAYELLKAIDEKHCKIKNSTRYHYDMRNRSTAHVYMILASALQQIITKSTALFFLNTDHSLSTEHSIEGEDKTHSPWIHMELMFSYFIWQARKEKGMYAIAHESATLDSVPVLHEAYTGHLKKITRFQLSRWLGGCENNGTPVDIYDSLSKLYRS